MPVLPPGSLPPDLPPYIYGTTRLGHAELPRADRLAMARVALSRCPWVHTSHQYDDALEVLGEAIAADPELRPRTIIKLPADSAAELRQTLDRNLAPLGAAHVDVGQLCLRPQAAAEFASGGAFYEGLRALKQAGRVRSYVLEVFPWSSDTALRAFSAGHADGVVDGCILYLNPLQRFASNALWQLLGQRQVPVIGMRTVAGGDIYRLRDVPGAAWKPYLQERACQVAPLFERSGARSWAEFCVRFSFSFPNLVATVGSTASEGRLGDFLQASRPPIEPLGAGVFGELLALQSAWAEALDSRAQAGSL